MFFNGGLIPNYFLVKYLHLTETIWSLILPGLVNTFYLIVARNFIMTVPESLLEAAKIDGANEIRILASIVVPVCKPIIATVALWAAVYHWNAWFDCMIYITKPERSVLQVVLFRIINSGSYDLVTGDFSNKQTYPEVVKACTIMVTVIPIVMVYPFLQKYFIQGMLIGSVKG
jgi:putative aldouronate transport system permease protein